MKLKRILVLILKILMTPLLPIGMIIWGFGALIVSLPDAWKSILEWYKEDWK